MNQPATTIQASQFELNKGDNFIFGVDVSASMGATDCPNGVSRIEYLKEKVKLFAVEASKWDEDGIDVLTFGQKVTEYRGITAEKAAEVITPLKANEMQTQTADLISKAYEMHKEGGYEQTVLFIATDGAPSNPQAVKDTIVDITTKVANDKEFTISILTVGQIDSGLQAFLTDLDDNLEGAKHDIVDVKSLEEVDFMEAFAGALND